MDRFLRRQVAPDSSCDGSSPPGFKRQRTESVGQVVHLCGPDIDGGPSHEGVLKDPLTLISWNVNGLVPQLKSGWTQIKEFIGRERPDILCLQEVRLPAAGPPGCKRGDGQRRRRAEAMRHTQQQRDDWQLVEKTFLAAVREDYTVYLSLADWKYAGTALLVRKPLRPSRVSYNLPSLGVDGGHTAHCDKVDVHWHPDGRVIFAEFSSFDVLTTYAPNNGSDVAAFGRREAWDLALLADLGARQRPLVWLGDLNCAIDDVDVTHPDWFAKQCYQGDPLDMRGQPGFTPGERRRFREILAAAKLVDPYRVLHPVFGSPPTEGPHYTWRGHPPVHQVVAKYFGKGMCIDYALVAEDLLPRVQEAEILGHGPDRHGFMGSDHSPIRLVLSQDACA